jgi:hypothetical protein
LCFICNIILNFVFELITLWFGSVVLLIYFVYIHFGALFLLKWLMIMYLIEGIFAVSHGHIIHDTFFERVLEMLFLFSLNWHTCRTFPIVSSFIARPQKKRCKMCSFFFGSVLNVTGGIKYEELELSDSCPEGNIWSVT